MKVVKYLGFNTPFADSKGLCGATPKYLTTAEHGGIFLLRYRLSETLITLLTINASTFERYRYNKLRLLRIVIVIIHVVIGKQKLNLSFTKTTSPGSLPSQGAEIGILFFRDISIV